jgi:hypothetical protein
VARGDDDLANRELVVAGQASPLLLQNVVCHYLPIASNIGQSAVSAEFAS